MNCGTDIVEIYRIKDIIEEHGNIFLKKIYTDYEIEYCESRKNMKYQHYAARFAAKEAVSKFFETGFTGGFDVRDIEIRNNEAGKPYIVFYGEALELFKEKGYKEISISLSHSKEYAISMVVGY